MSDGDPALDQADDGDDRHGGHRGDHELLRAGE
jgi:hypothetical protein